MNYRKINRLWQSATLFLAPPLLVVLLWLRPFMNPYQWLLWRHLPLLMLHEAQEYVLAARSFKQFFNLDTPMGSGIDPDFPLDEGYVFQVNLMIAWPMVILGAILAPVAPWLGFSMIWFQLILNNVMHTILFQVGKPGFNPGLITYSFLLLQYGTWTLLTAVGCFAPLDWILSALVGVGIAAVLAVKTRGRLAGLRNS
ncbi:MAG: HXXEE domain-containing protein [Spirochaetia bacterium]|nr:HXXEE domain-containing protein [Spirochaetia bacterium]